MIRQIQQYTPGDSLLATKIIGEKRIQLAPSQQNWYVVGSCSHVTLVTLFKAILRNMTFVCLSFRGETK